MRFGCPEIVISDNGTQFSGKIFNEMLERLGIRHRFTPPYAAQANPVERTNKTIKTMISQFSEENHRDWDKHLAELQFAINSSVHDSTGFSPALLNFGRELEPPGRIKQVRNEIDDGKDPNALSDWHQRLNRLREVN